jgi:ATP-dependent DNA helicase HFM1/MER3
LKGQLRPKKSKYDQEDDDAEPEIIDLADELPTVSYGDLSPYDNGKPVRLPKQKPRFSYASGQQSELQFLQGVETDDDAFHSNDMSQEEDFPSPSAMLNVEGDAGFPFEGNVQDNRHIPFDLPEGSEAATAGFDELSEPVTPATRVDLSFENGVFDFAAFNEPPPPVEGDPFSSPLMQTSLKRPLTPEPPRINCRRVKRGDTTTNAGDAQGSESVKQGTQQRSTPAWVDEFDPALIDDLRGIVDFVD